ncbi:hypothetical protein ACFP81_05075 [Deinococcus lacus]|uniref:Uncharacterized protein n=1 Tax=Deinococcus lacus TaxID=392561 RepID=A0ABW1YD30_9DEIO
MTVSGHAAREQLRERTQAAQRRREDARALGTSLAVHAALLLGLLAWRAAPAVLAGLPPPPPERSASRPAQASTLPSVFGSGDPRRAPWNWSRWPPPGSCSPGPLCCQSHRNPVSSARRSPGNPL